MVLLQMFWWQNSTPGDEFGDEMVLLGMCSVAKWYSWDVFCGEMVLLGMCSVARWYSWGYVLWRDGTPGDVFGGEMVLFGIVAVDKSTRARFKVAMTLDTAPLQHSSTSLA